MILLLFLIPTIAFSAEINWKTCIKETKCYMLDECKGGGTSRLLLEYPAPISEYREDQSCNTGFQNSFFTSEMALYQMQVKADDISELSIYHGDKLLIGCKKENGKEVTLIGDEGFRTTHRIVLFERRSAFEKDRAICALNLYSLTLERLKKSLGKFDPVWNSKEISLRYLNSAGQSDKFVVSLSQRSYFYTSNDFENCDPYSFQDGTPIDNYHVLPIIDKDRKILDCTNYKHLTYALRSTRYDISIEIESMTCTDSHEYQIKRKGSTDVDILQNAYNYQFFCTAPIDRLCENPFAQCTGVDCPKFTAGTDAERAKLECADNKWLIDGEYFTLQDSEKPTCKEDEVPNKAAFFINFASGPMRLSESEKVSCFTNYDCMIKSNLDYSDCKEGEDATCGVVLTDNGIMKCKDPSKYKLSVTQADSNITLTPEEYSCNVASGEWEGKDGTGNHVILLEDAQIRCYTIHEEQPKSAEATFTEGHVKLIIAGAVIVALIVVVISVFCTYRVIKSYSLSKVTKVNKKKWMKYNVSKRVEYAKETFKTLVNASTFSDLHIVHGFNVLQMFLDTNTEELEVWDHVYPFLARVNGVLNSRNCNLTDLYNRYMYLQAKKIIDKHGWISTTRITKSKPNGLIRCAAIQLISHCPYFRIGEDASKLLEEGFRKLGFNAVEQYPHCGLLWSIIAQLYTTRYSHPTDPNKKDVGLDAGRLLNQLIEISKQSPAGLEQDEIFPQFGSISNQASFAIGAATNFRISSAQMGQIFQKADKPDKSKEEEAKNFLSGMGYSISNDPGCRILRNTLKSVHDYPKRQLIENFVAFHDIMRSIAPEYVWKPIIAGITKIMVFNHHSQDVKRLENLVFPDAKDSTEYMKLRASQELFEEAVREQSDELWEWFSSRIDLDELKTRPTLLTYNPPPAPVPVDAELPAGCEASLELIQIEPHAKAIAAELAAAPPVAPPSSEPPPSDTNPSDLEPAAPAGTKPEPKPAEGQKS